MNHLTYHVPILESLRESPSTPNADLVIKGIAINATMTRNGVYYGSEELRKAATTLTNKPILKDHNNSVDSIIGRTKASMFNEQANAVTFEGIIKDPKMKEMIEQGLITSVSIGAMVQDIQERSEEDGGGVAAIGIDFVEISLVAVPADPNAGFTKALLESYQSTSQSQTKEPSMEESMEEKKTIEALRSEQEALRLEIEALRTEQLRSQKELLMKQVAEVAVEKPVLKGEVSKETNTPSIDLSGYTLGKEGRKVILSVNTNNESLTRLRRN